VPPATNTPPKPSAAPERSLNQRMDALERANKIRTARAQLKRDLKAGKVSIHQLLLKPPSYLETAKVFDMLLAVPKYGRVKANKILQTTTIAEDIPRSATIAADLSAVRCPVFAIFGGDSGLAAQVPHFETHLESCRCVVLPDQGHSVLVERTEEVIELVSGWVRDTARTRTRVR